MEPGVKINKNELQKICRCCLKEVPVIDIIINNLPLVLNVLFSIEVNQALPSSVCKECANEIVRFCGFRERVIKANEILIAVASETEKNDPNIEANQQEDAVNDQMSGDDVEIFRIEVSDNEDEDEENKEEIVACDDVKVESVEVEEPKEQEFEEKQTNNSTKYVVKSKPRKIKKCSCGEVFHEWKAYIAHRKQVKHRRLGRHPCQYCGKEFDATSMKSHITKHTKEKPFVCDICGLSYSAYSNLKRHKYRHATNRLVCEVCGKAFTYPESLKIHLRSHKNEDPFFCTSCGQGFKEEETYREHKLIKHKKNITNLPKYEMKDGPRECEVCNKSCGSAIALKAHLMTHGERNFLCTACGNTFYTRSALNIHFRVHSGERPYACQLCDKAFSHPGTLKVHIVTHTGERPFVCKVCSKTFTQRTHLRTHMVVHSEKRLYKCPFCEKTYRQRTSLVVHQRSHTGETPYNCDQCGRGFYHSTAMKKHRTIHFKENSKLRKQIKAEKESVQDQD